jgi:hypothetical protein
MVGGATRSLHPPPLGLRPRAVALRAPGSAAPGRILDTPIVQNVAAPLTDATNY